MTISNTLLQEYVKDQYVGRVMSLYLMQFGFTSLSAFAAGVLTQAWGLSWAIGGFAAALAVISVWCCCLFPACASWTDAAYQDGRDNLPRSSRCEAESKLVSSTY